MRSEQRDIDIIYGWLATLRERGEREEAVLSMTVSRLGGTVEGKPTQRVNFLQRVDELRDIERVAAFDIAKVMLECGDLKSERDALAAVVKARDTLLFRWLSLTWDDPDAVPLRCATTEALAKAATGGGGK